MRQTQRDRNQETFPNYLPIVPAPFPPDIPQPRFETLEKISNLNQVQEKKGPMTMPVLFYLVGAAIVTVTNAFYR